MDRITGLLHKIFEWKESGSRIALGKLNTDEIKAQCTQVSELIVKTPGGRGQKFEFPNVSVRFIINCYKKRVSGERELEEMRVVAEELESNARFHGNDMNPNKNIEIVCGWLDSRFYCSIKDEGKGFNVDDWDTAGVDLARQRVDLLYNFGDSTIYFYKNIENK